MATFPLGDLDKWVTSVQSRVSAVEKQSAQDVIEVAQKPRGKGGNMPVDTGYLRNSGQAKLNSLPSGESSEANETAVALVIYRAKPGDKIYFGWTAVYSRAMERKYGYMRLAAQKWDRIVALNAAKLKNASLSRGQQ